MYRKHPKRQDHGTRGTQINSGWGWGNIKRCIKCYHAEERKNFKKSHNVLFNKLNIDATEEEIEVLLKRTTFTPAGDWYWFD